MTVAGGQPEVIGKKAVVSGQPGATTKTPLNTEQRFYKSFPKKEHCFPKAVGHGETPVKPGA